MKHINQEFISKKDSKGDKNEKVHEKVVSLTNVIVFSYIK